MRGCFHGDSTMREQNLNLPNILTFFRIIVSFVVFALIERGGAWDWAAGLFVLASLTDVLDGYIARKYQLITQVGRILDPFADKFLTAGTFLFLLPVAGSGVVPWMVILILGREMLVTSLRSWAEQHGHDFSATASGKLKMFVQCLALTIALLTLDERFQSWMIGEIPLTKLRDVLLWTTVVATVISGYRYSVRAFRLMFQSPPSDSPTP